MPYGRRRAKYDLSNDYGRRRVEPIGVGRCRLRRRVEGWAASDFDLMPLPLLFRVIIDAAMGLMIIIFRT